MGIDFAAKIKEIGGVHFIEESNEKYIQENIEYIKNIMKIFPEDEIINFTKEYGFSMFNNNVYINSNEKNDFLVDGKIELGIVYGFGESRNSIKEIIKTYFKEEQLNKIFYPLFEGYPGDIIFYSLEKETFGKIYYWHHESEIGKDIVLVKNSFEELMKNIYFIEEESEKEISDKEPKIISVNLSEDLINKLKNYNKK
jgi:hypothetical protein